MLNLAITKDETSYQWHLPSFIRHSTNPSGEVQVVLRISHCNVMLLKYSDATEVTALTPLTEQNDAVIFETCICNVPS